MTNAVFIPWQNPLAKLVEAPGGMKAGAALDAAEANLEAIQSECLDALDAQIGQLDRICADATADMADETKGEVYALANDVHSVAGTFNLTELSEAAYSLCELVDNLRSTGRWNKAAVDVHVSSFHLLRHPDAADRSSVVRGLRRVTEQMTG